MIYDWIDQLCADLADLGAPAQEPPFLVHVLMTDVALDAGLDLASCREWIVGFLQADSAFIWHHAPEGTNFYVVDPDDFFDLGTRYEGIQTVAVDSKPIMLVKPPAQEHAASPYIQ